MMKPRPTRRQGRGTLSGVPRSAVGPRLKLALFRLALGVLLFNALPSQQLAAQDLAWERVGMPVGALDDLYFDDEGALWVLGYSNDGTGIFTGLFRLEPGADEWTVIALTENSDLPNADFVVLTEAGDIIVSAPTTRSLDGGETYEEVFESGGALHRVTGGPRDGLLLTPSRGAVTGAAYSTDDGATWTAVEIDPGTTSFGQALAFDSLPDGPHAGRVVAACMNGLAYSDDGGASWVLSDTWEPFAYRVISLARLPLSAAVFPGRLYAGMYDTVSAGSLYASDDDGETWSRVYDFGNNMGAPIVRWAGGQRLFAVLSGRPGAVWGSEDAGVTWEELTSLEEAIEAGGQVTVGDIEVGPEGRLWAAVQTPGPSLEFKGVYRTVEPVAVSAEPAASPIAAFALEAAYPNPASGLVTVPLILAEPSAVSVAVYDVLGRRVAVLADGRYEAGRHRAELDASGLGSGTYLVRAQLVPENGSVQTFTQKLTLVR